MKMQLSKIAMATSLAIAAMGAHAASGSFNPAVTYTTIYFSGASAPDAYLSDVATSMLSPATGVTDPISGNPITTVVKFSGNTGGTSPVIGSDSNYRAYFGKTTTAYTSPAGFLPAGTIPINTYVLLIKRSKSGSDAGVNPVATGSYIETLDLTNCDSVNAGTGYDYGCGVRGSDSNPADSTGMIPDFGASDVEPAMFKAPYNVTAGLSQLTSGQLGNLNSRGVNLALFAPVATDAVPAATYFSRAIYSELLTHKVDTWDQIDAVNNTSADNVVVCRRVNGSGTQATFNWFYTGFPCTKSFNGEANTIPASYGDSTGFKTPVLDSGTNAIVLDGSGNNVTSGETFYGIKNTKASLIALGGANCTPVTCADGVATFNHPGNGTGADKYNPLWTNATSGYTVVNNSGSGDVRNCLKNAQSKTDHIAQGEAGLWYGVNFSAGSSAFKAVGVLGMDSMGQESGWHFRTLDGAGTVTPQNAANGACTGKNTNAGTICDHISVAGTGLAPSKDNLNNGKWDMAPELSVQYRKTTLALTGPKKGFIDTLISNLGKDKYTGNNGATINGVPAYSTSLPTLYTGNGTTVGYFTHEGNTCSPLHKY